MSAAVEFKNVTKRYGSVVAVKNVSFTIEAGTLVTLLGPSGCGKTTTLRMIAGLELATEGDILIGDENVTLRSTAERDVSMVFQSYALFPHMNVLANVAYGLIVSGVPKPIAHERARLKLELVGLKGFDLRLPSELSGGQQQRVAVARALVLEPAVLLFDEPLSNLDAKLRRKVRDDIRELQQRLNLTVAYVTHDQQEALAVSDKIIVMSNAEIAQIGTPRELYETPIDLFVADFIGDANLVKCHIQSIDNDRAMVDVGDLTISLLHRGMEPGPAIVAIRPESLLIRPEKNKNTAFPAEITKVAYLGSHLEYGLKSSLGELFAIDRNVLKLQDIGSHVWVELADHGIALVPAK